MMCLIEKFKLGPLSAPTTNLPLVWLHFKPNRSINPLRHFQDHVPCQWGYQGRRRPYKSMPDVPPMPNVWIDGRHPDNCVDLPIQTDSFPRFAVQPHPYNHAGPGLRDLSDDLDCLRLLPTGLRRSQLGPKVA